MLLSATDIGKTQSRSTAAAAAVALATVAFGSGPVAAAMTPASAGTITVARFVLAVPLLFAALQLGGQRLSLPTLRRCVPGGILLPLQVGLFFEASRLTSVADATFIMSLQPLLMLLATPRLFREGISRAIVGWTLAGIAGVGLVIFGSVQTGTADLAGELVAVANLVVWTAYLLASKWARSGEAPLDALSYQCGVNAVGALLMVITATVLRFDVSSVPATGWLGIVFITASTGVVGHVLNTWSQRYLAQTVSSVILLLQPVVAMLGAAAFLHQPLTVWATVGAAIVIVSAAGSVQSTNKGQ
jgi:drug/metabolite transporter (DMT)-like permease